MGRFRALLKRIFKRKRKDEQKEKTVVAARSSTSTTNNDNDDTRQLTLYLAARAGKTTAVHVLLTNGADANSPDGQSALRVAAGNGLHDIMMILIQHGADINATDSSGNAPLHRAVRNGQGKSVRLLVQHGAKPYLGSPSPVDLAKSLWNPVPLASFMELVEEHWGRPSDKGESSADCILYQSKESKPLESTGKARTEKDRQILDARLGARLYPDRIIYRKGKKYVIPPSEPAYWN